MPLPYSSSSLSSYFCGKIHQTLPWEQNKRDKPTPPRIDEFGSPLCPSRPIDRPHQHNQSLLPDSHPFVLHPQRDNRLWDCLLRLSLATHTLHRIHSGYEPRNQSLPSTSLHSLCWDLRSMPPNPPPVSHSLTGREEARRSSLLIKRPPDEEAPRSKQGIKTTSRQ